MVDLMKLMCSALDASDRLTLAALDGQHDYHAKGERDFALAVDLAVENEVHPHARFRRRATGLVRRRGLNNTCWRVLLVFEMKHACDS